jgi:arginyl-tRNA synthetase
MKELIVNILKKALGEYNFKNTDEEINNLLEVPPTTEMGDYAFPCFIFAKELNMNPHQVALELRQLIGTQNELEFDDIITSGPYINFFVNRKEFASKTVREIINKKEKYGRVKKDIKKKTMIEFSQTNTHKAFHVGHIRGTSIGESLARIFEFCGDKVIRANYSGDTGMHVAKWIWCYEKYHSEEELSEDEKWIASIYVDAVKRLAKNKELQKEVDDVNRMIDSKKDKKLNRIWERTKKLSISSWDKIYKDLNTGFDVHFFESEVEKRGREIAKELVEKKIAKISDEATIIKFNDKNLGVWVLLRSDGTVLYSAKDLALVEKKFKKYKINKNIYVMGSAQTLHMNQLFKTLELMQSKNVEQCYFVPLIEVRLPAGKMSSRTGDNILYSDFLEEIMELSKKGIKERYVRIDEKTLEKRALAVSIAAMKYSMLKQSPNREIVFNKKEALNFEGDTGAYILYSYARANSILEKAKIDTGHMPIETLKKQEIELISKLASFQETVFAAYKSMNPSIVAHYTYELAQIFNEFYHSCQVVGSREEPFRIALVKAFKIVLGSSLYLLGIEPIDEM